MSGVLLVSDKKGTKSIIHNAVCMYNYKKNSLKLYRKNHLVPFGEYTPLKWLLPNYLHKKLNQFIGMGQSLTAGHLPGILQIKNLTLGIMICFEDIFPSLSYRYSNLKVDALVNVTNDAWFRESVAMTQHTQQGRLRAIENRLPMIRSGNHGDSVLVGSNGKLIKPIVKNIKARSKNQSFGAGYKIYSYEFGKKGEMSFYSRFPLIMPFFSSISVLLMLLFIIFSKLNTKRKLTEEIK